MTAQLSLDLVAAGVRAARSTEDGSSAFQISSRHHRIIPPGQSGAAAPNDPDSRFAEWLERYPWVLPRVAAELRADLESGRRLSVKAVVEDLRNGRRGPLPHDGQFGWNNNLTGRLAHFIAQTYADLRPHIPLRRLG